MRCKAKANGKRNKMLADETTLNPKEAEMAVYQLEKVVSRLLLDGCQVHTTVMTSEVDRKIFKKLGIGLTSEPVRKD